MGSQQNCTCHHGVNAPLCLCLCTIIVSITHEPLSVFAGTAPTLYPGAAVSSCAYACARHCTAVSGCAHACARHLRRRQSQQRRRWHYFWCGCPINNLVKGSSLQNYWLCFKLTLRYRLNKILYLYGTDLHTIKLVVGDVKHTLGEVEHDEQRHP